VVRLALPMSFEDAWHQVPITDLGQLPELAIDAKEEDVQAFLHFIYTGSVDSDADPGELLRLAHSYGLDALVQCSADRLASSLTRENAVEAVRAIRPYRDHPACEGAWKTMLANVQQILSDDAPLLEDVLLSV